MVRIELVKTSLLHLLLHIPRYTDYLLQTSIQIHCIFFSIEPGIIFFLRKWLLTPPGACCTTGFKHEGTPVGEVKNISGGMFRVPRRNVQY